MIKDIQELNFPSYATLSSATVTLNDMGDRTISTQVKIDGDIVPDFSYDWEVEFKGERYIQPLRQPQASKGNESMRSTIDLVFYHKTIWQLKRYYFVEMTSTESGTAIADQYIASLGLNLSDFCVAFQKVLDHYFNGEISIDLNPNLDYTKGVQFMSISYSYIWDVLQKMYEVYGVRWYIEGNTIKVGYPSPILSHTFQYGYEGGLLQVERQVQDANIRNSLLGRGGEQNLPAYYFKEAPEGSLFASDPDAIPELANIYFSNLRGKTFRDYVKGWKAKHYGGEPMNEPTEAYTKGYTDTKFNPIEYVEDKVSIEKYGLLQGALDNNEEIYPSIQGAPNGEDVVVYVEPVTSDDVEQSVGKAETINFDEVAKYKNITREDEGKVYEFDINQIVNVPDNSYALVIGNKAKYSINYFGDIVWSQDALVEVTETVTTLGNTGVAVDKDNLSKGEYSVRVHFKVTVPRSPYWDEHSSSGVVLDFLFHIPTLAVSTTLKLRKLQDGTIDKWLPTFDIWVKNIWHSTRNVGESDEQYAERVWRPILGDRQGNEAKVVFSSGWLSGHEDYEFTIVDFAYDNSHDNSEWRLTLAKSDAELEATGKYIPSASTNGQAYAGDTFFFIGIDMPHQYVLWAEERLDNYKTSSLNEVSEIQPKWVVRFDKLRLHEGGDNLAEQIVVGGAINLADVRFIDAPSLQLYLQSVTYTWNEQTLLYPDIEVVLADTIVPVQNPVAQLQGSIDAINSQLYNIGNVAQTVRKIGDSLYLRKDGVADISKSPTKFVGNVSGNNFRQGKVGGADWGIYRDENGNAIAEFDKIIARKDLEVNNLVINQVSAIGGEYIASAAAMTISRVIETEDAYQCFFDQKGGSIANLFQVNDIAYSQRFDEENNATKYYKRKVVAVDIDSITLSKSQADGNGIPMNNDNIVQMGNFTDTSRQGVIIISSNPVPSITQYQGVNSFTLPDPVTKISPNDNEFTGKVHIGAGSTGVENIEGLTIGKNLLRNSGFTGDYTPIELEGTFELGERTNVYSDSFKYWTTTNAKSQASDFSQSKIEVVLANGVVTQHLTDAIVVGDTYIFSLYAKGESLKVSFGGIEKDIITTNAYEYYIIKIVPTKAIGVLQISSENAVICMPQLERGNIPTSWGLSVYDNDKSLQYLQALKYLSSAMKDGSTDIIGGLILSNILMLGNYQNGKIQKITAGISGVYNDANDVAFWAGNTLQNAINTVRKFAQNPRYNPSNEEWNDMANFVATHGGDIFLRGYIYALGGLFRGAVDIANGKISLNADGSGHLADGNIRWDVNGNVKKISPDSLMWTNITAYKDSHIVDFTKGAYINMSYDTQIGDDVVEYTLSNGAFDGYSFIIKSEVITRMNYKQTAVLLGDFYLPFGDVANGIFCDNVLNGVTLSYDSLLSGWNVETSNYNIIEVGNSKIAYISDSPNGYTGNVDIALSDGSVKNFTIVNGIIKQIN